MCSRLSVFSVININMKLLDSFFFLIIFSFYSSQTQSATCDVCFPGDTGMIDVTVSPYNAKGNGTDDDAAALQAAISAHVSNVGMAQTLYLPPGTYKVCDTLEWKSGNDWGAFLSIQGAGSDKTIIKLEDGCAGFDSAGPATKKAVLFTASHGSTKTDGAGGSGFRINISDLTIDVGDNNPGAVAIDFIGNNQASISNVNIIAGVNSGYAGILLARSAPGPALLKNIDISGFDYGIYSDEEVAGITIEDLSLNNQRVTGIYNIKQTISIRGIRSQNDVPVIVNTIRRGLITVIDGYFVGGANASDQSAIIDNASIPSCTQANGASDGGGGMYIRSVTAIGYQNTLNQLTTPNGDYLSVAQNCLANTNNLITAETISEHSTIPAIKLFPTSADSSLHLPIELTPTFHDNDPGHWINVLDYTNTQGEYANQNDWLDDTVAIQKAIDAATNVNSTVYFPVGRYILTDTLHLRGSIRRFIGFNVKFFPKNATLWNDPANPVAVFSIEDDSNAVDGIGDVLSIEGISWEYNNIDTSGAIVINHASRRDLVIKRSLLTGGNSHLYSYNTDHANVGDLYFENAIASSLRLNTSQNVWARQFNLEGYGPLDDIRVKNNGANLWVLGTKSETLNQTGSTRQQPTNIFNLTGGGKTEILGGLFTGKKTTGSTPIVESSDSQFSLSYGTITPLTHKYEKQIRETRSVEGVMELLWDSVPIRGYRGHSMAPLFSGFDSVVDNTYLVNESFNSASHNGAMVRTGSSKIELSTEQSSSGAYALKFTDSADTILSTQPEIHWDIVEQSNNELEISFSLYKDGASNSLFGVDINNGSSASNRVLFRYNGDNLLFSHNVNGSDTNTVLASGVANNTWYKITIAIETTVGATTFSASVTSQDGVTTYGINNAIPIHNNASGPIKRIHIIDDGLENSVTFVDDVSIKGGFDDDGDGLINLFELSLGTDPNSIDSDGDTVSDYDEIAYDGDATSYVPGQDTNPLNRDSDNDSFNDALEIAAGSDPNSNTSTPSIAIPGLNLWNLGMLTILLLFIGAMLVSRRENQKY